MDSRRLYFRLLEYLAPYWKAFLVSVLAMAVAAATEPALPALLQPMLDGTFVKRDPAWLELMPFLIVGLFVIRGIATYVATYASNWVGNKVVLDLRAAMFQKLVALPAGYFGDQSSGVLISRVTFDAAQVTQAASGVVTVLFKDCLTILGLLGWLFYLDWKLTLIALLMAPPIMLIIRSVSRRLRSTSRDAQEAMGEMTQVLQEAIEGHKVVKVFGGQDYEIQRFTETANRARRHVMKQVAAAAANVPFVQLVAALALAFIVALATRQGASDQTTVGGFVSFIVAMLMLTAPLKRLTGINEYLQKGLAAAESVFSLLDQQAEADDGTAELGPTRGEVRFEGVTFHYPQTARPALLGVDLTVASGQTVALVGPSGSGKTTLVNLLPAFYRPTQGRVLLDGRDIRSIRLADLRSRIALVSQEVVLFNDTVAANIAYGAARGASEADIIAAAQAAHAWEFISRMPEGLNTRVGEHGVKLSGGQRQRIAIARTLLKNAPVVILDEATSALDSESERHIQAALETLMKGRTTLVIAHRLSTVERADRIVVLDQGRIAESGSHSELLALNGLYAHLYRIQFRDGSTAAGSSG